MAAAMDHFKREYLLIWQISGIVTSILFICLPDHDEWDRYYNLN